MALEIDMNRLRKAVRASMFGWSYRQTSEHMKGVSTSTLNRFMRGDEPDLQTFICLLDWTGLDPNTVIKQGPTQGELVGRKAQLTHDGENPHGFPDEPA